MKGSSADEENRLLTHPKNPTCKTRTLWLDIIDTDCIDDWARVLFPICFAAFNAMYWLIYLLPGEQNKS